MDLTLNDFDYFPGEGYDWVCICSEHEEIYEDCDSCMSGLWIPIKAEENQGRKHKVPKEYMDKMLSTEEGRSRLARAMVAPIKKSLFSKAAKNKLTFLDGSI